MWNRQHVQQVNFLNNPDLGLSFDELLHARGPGFGPKTVDGLERTFVLGFKQILGIRDQHDVHGLCLTKGLLDAICLFVPSALLDSIGTIIDSDIPDIPLPKGSVLYEHTCNSSTLRDCAGTWSAAQFQASLPCFIHAFDRLNEVKSEQLLRLATLYDQFPA